MFDKSNNEGTTWGSDIFVTTQPGGWDFNVSGINRCNGMPITACDTSHFDTRGNIYIVWGDQRNGSTNSDVFFIKSTNNGRSWTGLKQVNNDNTTRHQFFPWMCIDQSTGFIYVIFYDRRATTGDATDVYMARSRDAGETFENFKISQSSFTPKSSIFFGDYTNIAAAQRQIYPIWMRLDNNTLSVWTAPFYDTTGRVPVELRNFSCSVNFGEVNLSWETATELNNKCFEIERADQSLLEWRKIGTVNGYGTSTLPHLYSYKDQPDNPGFYRYRLKQIDFDGTFKYSDEIEADISHPQLVELLQNYPNPFNPKTTIAFRLPGISKVSVSVYDVLGNKIRTLIDEIKASGLHEVDFDASDLPSGVYLYRLQIGTHTYSKQMILLK